MKYPGIRKGFMVGIFMAALALTITVMAQEIPKVPDFEKMLKWTPERDRSMVVTFPSVRFKFEILDWRESEACKEIKNKTPRYQTAGERRVWPCYVYDGEGNLLRIEHPKHRQRRWLGWD